MLKVFSNKFCAKTNNSFIINNLNKAFDNQ